MAKTFASQGDLEPKKVTFTELAKDAYAYTAEGDPNSGVIIGDDGVMVIDTQATPIMAEEVIARIREVTDKPIKYVFLTHYHAVRVLGASAYRAEQIIASEGTHDLIVERGEADFESEVRRFPRLFQGVASIPGLTWPTMAFKTDMVIWMGRRRVELKHLGRGHTKGDAVAWLPDEKILFGGDLVEHSATPYTGDAYLRDWPETLQNLRALGPEKLVPGRGGALQSREEVESALDSTQGFLTDLFEGAKACREQGKSLKETYDELYERFKPKYGQWFIFEHCMPFNVSRAYDEAGEYPDPRIWTADRDMEMWQELTSG